MSDFLAEMEARRGASPKRDAPIAAVVTGLGVALVAPFFLTFLTVKPAARVIGGQAGASELALYLATVAGLGLGLAGLVWVTAWFASVRQSRPDWGLRFLGGLVAAGVLTVAGSSAWAGYREDRQSQEKIAAVEIRKVMNEFLVESLEGEIEPGAPRARGRVGAVEKKARAAMAEAIRIKRKYEVDLEALDLDGMTPRGSGQADIKAFADRFEKARVLTVAYRAAMKKQLTATRLTLETSGFKPWIMRTYLPNYDGEFRRKQGRLDRRLDLQEEYLELSRDRMLLLHRTWGHWRLRDYRIMFERLGDFRSAETLRTQISYISWRMDRLEAEDRQSVADFEGQLIAAGIEP